MSDRKRILTGDRPTGRMHLGHYVGSLQNRVRLQDEYDCYFLVADLHMLTTRPQKEHIDALRVNVHEMVLDYLAVGIDPQRSTIYLQSAVHAVYEMNLFFEMLVTLPRLTRLPSIKDMARAAGIDEESVPFGLIGYPVLQAADILMPRSALVPVGQDNKAHVEITREIARRFNAYYGEVFPVPEAMIGDVPTLIGTDGQAKMSKSLDNCIFLSDDAKVVDKKVRGMFTDPNRTRADIPGRVEGNPVFIYHDAFNPNTDEVDDLKERYLKGAVGDVEVKTKLAAALNAFLDPIRERRADFENQPGYVEQVIYEGTLRTQEIANETVTEMKKAMGLTGVWNRISRKARGRMRKAEAAG
ncbi:tryptophan--tRNA ligase [Candidatus Poribacteria bacterium]|jgi:tryptophanyl-tRNA synthetase|nr:tryptophan--tRNA ligase [Candidatus Poribacteria bacterium]MBT5531498.1 tryptophan--tRNA ligase [Candidatus Poribacteria bacterium]MBT5712300.1 tryptophan--tRNA ligase [Candidatus Poribacteria bacterium]MBT7095794.1 tryptophan--tRNA ligase [Candidatus Poribacteria bacterium]MBT7805636.1 tryptophan--tRNA ligase [Candidatus Poribacteria bacterium]